MKAITARKAAAHITPLMDAMWHRGIVTAEDCIFDSFEKFAADIASNNEVRIRSGVGMLQGRFFCIEPGTYDSAAISNGTQGEKRIDLIVARWTVNASSETEDVEVKVIQGTPTTDTPVAPGYTEGNLDNGELVADLPLYEVNVNGINIESLSAQFEAGWLLRNGTLPVSKGGTGKTSHTSNAVLTGNGASAVKNVVAANGALYATSANGAPRFGVLPIAQGGTGSANKNDAKQNLGLGHIGSAASARGSASTQNIGISRTAITLNTWISRNDTAFEFVNGGIKMPYAGDVLVSGAVYPKATTVASGCYVAKGTASDAAGSEIASQYISGTSGAISSGAKLITVEAGDVIYLQGRSSEQNTFYPNNSATHLSVIYMR